MSGDRGESSSAAPPVLSGVRVPASSDSSSSPEMRRTTMVSAEGRFCARGCSDLEEEDVCRPAPPGDEVLADNGPASPLPPPPPPPTPGIDPIIIPGIEAARLLLGPFDADAAAAAADPGPSSILSLSSLNPLTSPPLIPADAPPNPGALPKGACDTCCCCCCCSNAALPLVE